jgi:signal transduction histidine kinase
MCAYTQERLYIKKEYRSLRDNTEEQNAKLRSRNAELQQARDTEVYNAQLSERNRIAREIHDNVGHTLSRAILQVGALLAIHKDEPVRDELEEVRKTLDDAMNNIRSSVHDLHDDSIDVKENINQMTAPLKEKYNVHAELDISDDTPRPVKYAIIGITKEAISNIMKYSSSTDVDIRLNEHPSMYQLIVHDYTPEEAKKETSTDRGRASYNSKNVKDKNEIDYGMGLENIRGRVESVNGNLSITNDNGFRIFVTIPKSGGET